MTSGLYLFFHSNSLRPTRCIRITATGKTQWGDMGCYNEETQRERRKGWLEDFDPKTGRHNGERQRGDPKGRKKGGRQRGNDAK